MWKDNFFMMETKTGPKCIKYLLHLQEGMWKGLKIVKTGSWTGVLQSPGGDMEGKKTLRLEKKDVLLQDLMKFSWDLAKLSRQTFGKVYIFLVFRFFFSSWSFPGSIGGQFIKLNLLCWIKFGVCVNCKIYTDPKHRQIFFTESWYMARQFLRCSYDTCSLSFFHSHSAPPHTYLREGVIWLIQGWCLALNFFHLDRS